MVAITYPFQLGLVFEWTESHVPFLPEKVKALEKINLVGFPSTGWAKHTNARALKQSRLL